MSLKICSIASGSKGNCCYVSDGERDILIDLGISALRADKCLGALGVDPDGVSILVTHAHSDHIGGIKTFCKKHKNVGVYCRKECAPELSYALGFEPVIVGDCFDVGGIAVRTLPVSHDVPCFGYLIAKDGKSVAVVTDVGEIGRNTLDCMRGCGVVMLEANHDVAMLRANPHYTNALKARIHSAHGHLSNADCAAACAYLAANGVRQFILAHLSEENNKPQLAVSQVEERIARAGVTDAHVVAAAQNLMTGLFELC